MTGPVRTKPARGKRSVCLEDKVEFLSRPAAYPRPPARVETVETHMSWVFLTDTRAYKLKKPIRFRELDYRSLGARHRSCQREVELNRRLAPDIYLGVVPLVRTADGGFRLNGKGRVVDWLVEMLRLPEECTLEHRLSIGPVAEDRIRHLARVLVRFFREAVPATGLTVEGILNRLRGGILESRKELADNDVGGTTDAVNRVTTQLLEFLASRASLFRTRLESGRYVEGHGDLRPEHVYLDARTEGEVIITDCLEFDRRLRLLDPADELAFLGMECERLGESRIGAWLFDVYIRESGDRPPAELRDFHASWRALARARVSIAHLRAPRRVGADHWRQRAARYLELAAEHATRL